MAQAGDTLEHPVTGERIIWRQVARETAGELLQFDVYMASGGFVAAEHVHPKQEERFEVLAGALRFRIDGKESTLRAGERATVPAWRPHVWWNHGSEEGHVIVELRPSLRSEMFFETFFGLGKDVRTNRKGLPNPLRMAEVMREYKDEIRLAGPPLAVQWTIFTPLALLGWLFGYRGWYPHYTAAPLAKG